MIPKESITKDRNISHVLVRLTDIFVGLMPARDIPLRVKRSTPVDANVAYVM